MMEPPANNVIVVNVADGKKYKMVLKGDLGLLTIGKVKRYLHQATGVDPMYLLLKFNGRTVSDGQTGSDIGLFDGAVMHFEVILPSSSGMGNGGGSSAYSRSADPHPSHLYSSRSPAQGVQQGGGSPERRLQDDLESERIRQIEVDRYRRELERVREEETRKREMEKLREEERKREQQRQREEEESKRRAKEEEDRKRELERIREEDRKREQQRRMELEAREKAARAAGDQERALRLEMELRSQHSEINDLRSELAEMRRKLEEERRANRMTSAMKEATMQLSESFQGAPLASSPHNPPALVRSPATVQQPRPLVTTVDAILRRNLEGIAEELRVAPLQLDSNHTCAISIENDEYTLLITFDPITERLYLYSTVLNELPEDPMLRLRLYETLLGGALLGRDMAGGGVGVSLKNNLVLLSTSVDLRHCSDDALRSITPAFISSLVRWQKAAKDILLSGPMRLDSPTRRRAPASPYGKAGSVSPIILHADPAGSMGGPGYAQRYANRSHR